MSSRSGKLTSRNERWHEMKSDSHLESQAEMVEHENRTRSNKRRNNKKKVYGNVRTKMKDGKILLDESPSSHLNKLDREGKEGLLLSLFKSVRSLTRIEIYKDDRLIDDEFFEKRIVSPPVEMPIGTGISQSLDRTAKRLASELDRDDVAGVEMAKDGSLFLYIWKAESANEEVRKPRGAKKKKPTEEEVVEKVEEHSVLPAVILHYNL